MTTATSAHNIDWRLETIAGLGAKTLEKLHEANIFNVWQLLCHRPIRYEDYTKLITADEWQQHIDQKPILIEAVVTKVWSYFSKGRKITYCQLSDGKHTIRIGFFFLPPQIKSQLETLNISLRCFGKVVAAGNVLSMYHPKYWVIEDGEDQPLDSALTPIYKNIPGITANRLRKIILLALDRLIDLDQLVIHKKDDDLLLSKAMQIVHQPQVDDLKGEINNVSKAYWRLAEEEAVIWCAALNQSSAESETYSARPSSTLYKEKLLKALPFQLTEDQLTVLSEITASLQLNQPMRRLLQGDVGCGKTIVAILSALDMIEAGFQVAILAPTTILAQQHFNLCQILLKDFHIEVALLISNQPETEVNRATLKLGRIHLVIGTHALLAESTEFDRLGLVVVDEQHRFGVNQKQSLFNKGVNGNVHALLMSATPIPRSLAQSMFQVNDCSKIQSMPQGRLPIITSVLAPHKRAALMEKVIAKANDGQQIYWVCPRIDSEQQSSVMDLYACLSKQCDTIKVGLLHGRMKSEEKAQVLEQFADGHIQILVCTIVIEVGVNVPNANFMIIDDAQMYGLAQLHQLRGRVGRANKQGYCILNYSGDVTEEGVARLSLMKSCNDGFELANMDLMMRGPGELLGIQQSGCPPWRFLSWPEHQDLLTASQELLSGKCLNLDKKYLADLLWNQRSTLK